MTANYELSGKIGLQTIILIQENTFSFSFNFPASEDFLFPE